VLTVKYNYVKFEQIDSLFGSNPVTKSGQGACADDPAGVSGQHDQPSNVPGQEGPATEGTDPVICTLRHTLCGRSNQEGGCIGGR
jgi:hypothetical protein